MSIDEQKDDSENVLAFTKRFDTNADIRDQLNIVKAAKEPGYCRHERTVIDEHRRVLACRHCDKVIDPFDWVMSIANKEACIDWELSDLRREVIEHRKGLESLKREELNTRNRIKNAEGKLAKISMEIANKSKAAGIPIAALTKDTYAD